MTQSRISRTFENTKTNHCTFLKNTTRVLCKQKAGKPEITSQSPIILEHVSISSQSIRNTSTLKKPRKCVGKAFGRDFSSTQLCNPNLNDSVNKTNLIASPNSTSCNQSTSTIYGDADVNTTALKKQAVLANINLKINTTDEKLEDDIIAQNSLLRTKKELQQSRIQIEDLQREKIEQLEMIQIMRSNKNVALKDGKTRRERRVKAWEGMETQILVKSLGLQVEKLKDELIGRELSWSELKVAYKSLREEMSKVISKNIALSNKLKLLKELRKSDSAQHEKVYFQMKNQIEKLSRSHTKVNESIIVKSRIIEDQKRKYVKWKRKYTDLAKQYPEINETELKRQKRELSQSRQKVSDMKDMYKEQLSHLNQKEEHLSKAKNEVLNLQNDVREMKTQLIRYQEGDDVRKEIQTVSKNEVERLSAELATEKINTELAERSTKEKEVRLLSVERRLREELQVTKQKLYKTALEAEKNLLFFEGQAKMHDKIKNEHLHDLFLVEKGRSSQVKDLRRKIKE